MFSLYSGFNKVMTKVFDFLGLNVIFILLCLPIVTIGANVTALFSVTMKMAKNDDVYSFKLFFQEFFKNFKQATIIWLLLLAIFSLFYFDYRIVVEMNTLKSFLLPMLYFFIVLGFIYTLYVFPILAKFPNPIKRTLKNTFYISIGFLPYSLLLLFLIVFPTVATIYWAPTYTPYLLYFYLIIGVSYTFYLQSFLFNHIFKKIVSSNTEERVS